MALVDTVKPIHHTQMAWRKATKNVGLTLSFYVWRIGFSYDSYKGIFFKNKVPKYDDKIRNCHIRIKQGKYIVPKYNQ